MSFPAYEQARITGVKQKGFDMDTPRDFECFLREKGFSRSRAKAITA